MKTLQTDGQQLDTVVAKTSHLAESVSSKVRVLDLAKVNGVLPPSSPPLPLSSLCLLCIIVPRCLHTIVVATSSHTATVYVIGVSKDAVLTPPI